MNKQSALIVDDEADIRTLVSISLERMGLECFAAATVAQARELLTQRSYHFCITDMKLPDGNGLELIRYCQKNYPAMPVAMITAYGNMELGVNALKAGAFDVVAKPIDIDRLRGLAREALKLTQVPSHIDSLPSDIKFVGQSLAAEQFKAQLAQVARTQAPVCLFGEAGTGKELSARLIHHQSSRAQQAFIKVSCLGRNAKDLENELFAPLDPRKSALFLANKGTLYLEEVGQMPSELQARLLSVLQERTLSMRQDGMALSAEFRLVVSTSEDLQDKIQRGQFRQDLYFRVCVVPIHLMPLRERGEDINYLAKYFIQNFCQEWSIPLLELSDAAAQALATYSYNGNLDEMQNILRRAVSLCEHEQIEVADLKLGKVNTNNPTDAPPVITDNLEEYLQSIERNAIRHALETSRWNKTAAAAKLGLSFRTMRYRCKKLGID